MAKVITLDAANDSEKNFKKSVRKLFQSGNINFLIGSGASLPAIPLMGNVEQEINDLFREGKVKEANNKIYPFLNNLQSPMNDLIKATANANNTETLNHYIDFLKVAEKILLERKTNLLPKQANIFTTNYDLFIEKASESFPILKINDGFNRTPCLNSQFSFTPENYFNSIFNNGNLYNYKVEIPCINLMKLHGSISWKRDANDLKFSISDILPLAAATGQALTDEQIQNHINKYSLILPQKGKFQETLMDRIYYDLLRIFSNELDKENTLLIAFGFSFADEHIYDITKRALKNPTLKLVIFSYKNDQVAGYETKFSGYDNVEIVSLPGNAEFLFPNFNDLLASILYFRAVENEE